MAYTFNQPNLTGGLDEVFVDVATAVPTFPIGVLLFTWFMIFLGGASAQKTRSGYSDFPMWATLSSLSTMLIALLMTMRTGIINVTVLAVVISITVFSALWLFLSKGRGEV